MDARKDARYGIGRDTKFLIINYLLMSGAVEFRMMSNTLVT